MNDYYGIVSSVRKLGENCGKQWEDHWQCLEKHNQVSNFLSESQLFKNCGASKLNGQCRIFEVEEQVDCLL